MPPANHPSPSKKQKSHVGTRILLLAVTCVSLLVGVVVGYDQFQLWLHRGDILPFEGPLDAREEHVLRPFEGPLDRGQRLPPGPVLPNVDIDQINRDLEEADKKSKRERLEAFGLDERYMRKLTTLPDKDGNRIPDMIDFVYSQIEDGRKTGLIRALARKTRDIREDSGIELLVGNINPQLTVGKLAELYESYNFLGDKDGWKKAKKALIDSPDSDNYYAQ